MGYEINIDKKHGKTIKTLKAYKIWKDHVKTIKVYIFSICNSSSIRI